MAAQHVGAAAWLPHLCPLPGFGDSGVRPLEWYSISRYADHVVALCEQLEVRPHTIIGHSMGARITLDIGQRYPEFARQLVAVSPSISGRLGFNINVLMTGEVGRKLLDVSRKVWPMATAGVMSTYWSPRHLGSEAVKRTTEDLRRSSWEAAMGTLRMLAEEDYSDRLSGIRQPTLVICGARDYTIPPGDSHLAATRIPSARLVILDGIHHWPTDEDHSRFIDVLLPFVDNHRHSVTTAGAAR